MVDAQHNVMAINNAACRLLGETPDKYLSKPFPYPFTTGKTRRVKGFVKDQHGEKMDLEIKATQSITGLKDHIWLVIFKRENKLSHQKELEGQSSTYDSLIRNVPGFIFRCRNDRDWTMLQLTPQFEELTGYRIEDVLHNKGKSYAQIVHQEDRERIWSEVQSALEEKAPFELIYRVVRADGSVGWAWEHGLGVFDPEGNLQALDGFIMDITKAKQDEITRNETENLFRAVFDNSGVGIAIMDTQQKFLQSNFVFQHMLGYTAAELAGLSLRDITHPDDLTAEAAQIKKSLRETHESSYRTEKRYIRKDGKIIWGRLTATIVRDEAGKAQFGIGVVEDISERKLTEQVEKAVYEISQSVHTSRNLSQLFEHIHDVLADLMPVDNFYIALLNSKNGEISCPYFIDQYDDRPSTTQLGRGLTEYVIRTGQSLLASPEVFRDLVASGEVESVGAPSIDWLGVPLKIGEKIIGVMVVQSYVEGVRFSYRNLQVLEFVSTQIAMAVERKQAEDALRAEEEKYRSLFQASRDAVFLETLEGQIIDCNEVACKLFGYTKEEFKTLTLLDLLPRDIAITIPELIEKVLSNGYFNIESKNRRKDGTVFPVEVSSVLTVIDDLRLSVVYVRDLTEVKAASQSLQESEGKFLSLAETTSAIIVIHRGEEFLYTNPSFQSMIGYTDEELKKIPFEMTLTPEVRDYARKKAKERLEGGDVETRYQMQVLTRSGSEFWLDVTSGLIEYEGQKAIMITALDITERKQIEDDLKLQSTALTAAANAIVITNPDGIITWANPAFSTLTGYSFDELINHNINILESSANPPDLFDNLEKEIRQGHDWHGEVINRRKDGSLYTGEVSITPVKDEKGKIIHFVEIKQDITERKNHARELEAIAGIAEAIRASITKAELLPIIMHELSQLLANQDTYIVWKDAISADMIIQAGRGLWEQKIGTHVPTDEGLLGKVQRSSGVCIENDLSTARRGETTNWSDQVDSIAAVPLLVQGVFMGAIVVGLNRKVSGEDVRVLSAIGNLVASAINRAELFEQTRQLARTLTQAYDATIEGWARALELRDKETEGHTQRVINLTLRLCQALGVPGSEMEQVRRGVILHDIGKMGIPDIILLKDGPLTDSEWVVMKRHPLYAHDLMVNILYLQGAMDIPYCHHERWDGSGYPRSLKGEDIPFKARIFTVVDVWDALTSDRPYRKAWSREKTLKYISDNAGILFDPMVVSKFLDLYSRNELE